MDEKLKIAVVFTKCEEVTEAYHEDWEGRDTNESAFKIVDILKELGYDARYEFVNKDLFEKLRQNKPDLVFNLCDDGFYSDPELEPHLPAMLDVLEIPYTGGDYFTLALTLDKANVKEFLKIHKLPTPKFYVFEVGDEEIGDLEFPLIVKPLHEDASIGIKDDSVVYDEENLRERVRYVVKEYDQPALVEEFIDGREFNVGVIGNDEKEVMPISEITFDGLPEGKPKIVNYSAKWDEDSIDYKETKRSCPAKVDEELANQLRDLAIKAGEIFGCESYFRVDFRVDKNNNPYILEVNQNPDISDDAGLAAMAEVAGYSYKGLIDKVVKEAMPIKEENESKPEEN